MEVHSNKDGELSSLITEIRNFLLQTDNKESSSHEVEKRETSPHMTEKEETSQETTVPMSSVVHQLSITIASSTVQCSLCQYSPSCVSTIMPCNLKLRKRCILRAVTQKAELVWLT